MNDEKKQKIARQMMSFIEQKEQDLQASKLQADNRAKQSVINSILEELDREIENENK